MNSRRRKFCFRIGALAGWLGGAEQTPASQETAKNIITQSIEIFQAQGLTERVAEARGELALCYWREGSYDEARVTLDNALNLLGSNDSELKAILLIRAGIVEIVRSKASGGDSVHLNGRSSRGTKPRSRS